jgi:hypothetical protein
MSIGSQIEDFYDDQLARAKELVAKNLLEGWSIAFFTGWGSAIKDPEGQQLRHGDKCPKSVEDLADFADKIIAVAGADNTWVAGTKKRRKHAKKNPTDPNP